jgi:hypothetical protein
VKASPPNLIGVSAPTRIEVDYGLALNAARARKPAPMLDAFFSAIAAQPFDEADAPGRCGNPRCAQVEFSE